MAEEATLRVGLNPEDISLAVREGGEPIRRPARVPGIRSWPPMAVDEPKDNLVVLGEIRQDLRLTLLGEQQFSFRVGRDERQDRKSTRLNSSHVSISYAVLCLKE